ncbi:Crp/Fnr family transcriptional regulator [Lacticaseibacillus baoqingensis]|uniref:Crp/Fnr family transcriptional regulator n=1 Tax=Lacticaseibacillus baoqingensis TaxID=2486013 RepID=A0ABW4E791_9LACO|nr:Crp/Fnr family transcriptional regulator [Lacticaseibacillus baoqingensis]
MTLQDYYDHFKQIGHQKNVARNTDLLREGDVATQLYFVEQGAVRMWHNDDGRDITVQFFFEGQVVSSFESFYLKKPSLFTLTTIEPTTLTVVDGAALRQALGADPKLMAVFTDYVCHRFIDYTQYFLNRIQDSPEARYRTLLASDPKLVARVPKYELATYLGITPVSLSRIRNRVKKEARP